MTAIHWDAALITVIMTILLALLVEGFFSGSELALVSCDRLRLRYRSRHGSRGARLAEELLNHPAKLFSITLFGTNLSTITASTVTTFYLVNEYGPAYGPLAVLLSPVILLFAEIIPKSVYHHHADQLVDRVAPFLILFGTVFAPLVLGIQLVTDRLLGGVRRAVGAERRISREELTTILQGEETRGTDIKPAERTLVARILRLSELTAKNIMVPLIELEPIPMTMTRDAAIHIFDVKGITRIPVYGTRIYDIVGVIEAADVLYAETGQAISALSHPPVYIPEEMRLNELFRILRERREEVAVVVDEYGAAVGVVTREEIMEEVVGELRDEFELDEQLYRRVGASAYYVNARMEIETAARELGLAIPTGDYETLAGMLLQYFGHIPTIGEQVTIHGWQYEVRQATERAIVEVAVKRVKH